jgi:DNA transposition AAA+ family ATPase
MAWIPYLGDVGDDDGMTPPPAPGAQPTDAEQPVNDSPAGDAPQLDPALSMEAREIVKSIRIPPSGTPLTAEQRDKIRQAVSAHIRQHHITQNEVGLAVGRASNTISQVLSDNYKGDAESVLRLLNTWIEDDERRRRTARPMGFYSTSVFQSIKVLATYAKSNARVAFKNESQARQDSARIAVGFGPAGCGKTIGARALHAEDPASIYVRVGVASGQANALSRLIVAALGQRPAANTTANFERLRETLQDSGRLLIIDEAHQLKVSGCELLRDITDIYGVPALILGTNEIFERLTKIRTGGGNLIYDQFSRRVGMQIDLVRGIDGKGGERRPIYSLEDIIAIFKSDEVRLSRDGAEYLQGVACCVGIGMLGMAQAIWQMAFRSVRKKARPVVDAQVLREATYYVMLPRGIDLPELNRRIEESFLHVREMNIAAAG